jgi:hypothetical protein
MLRNFLGGLNSIHNSVNHVPVITVLLLMPSVSLAAATVRPEVQLPGTQPLEIGNLESSNKCGSCLLQRNVRDSELTQRMIDFGLVCFIGWFVLNINT